MSKCPLCGHDRLRELARDRLRPYLQCSQCSLVHVPKEFHLSPEEEAHRYRQHNNDPQDPAYRAFLENLLGPLRRFLPTGPRRGLDYGSGPGPAVAVILGEEGHTVSNFDPLFSPAQDVRSAHYEFVTCTEVVEHFARPKEEWERLVWAAAGAPLGIMTHVLAEGMDFATWYYKNDPTHVAFYTPATLQFIAEQMRLEILDMGPRHAIFRVPAEVRA